MKRKVARLTSLSDGRSLLRTRFLICTSAPFTTVMVPAVLEAASIIYFNKHASDLTLAERLQRLLAFVSFYDPTVNPEAAKRRRNTVLERMLRAGDITQEQYDEAVAEDLV